MAEDLAKNTSLGGYAVLSGFIEEQIDWVVDTYKQFGFELIEIVKDDNWRAVLMEKTK